jgi:hypothetical protein
MKTVRMKFKDDKGKDFAISLNYASPELEGPEGAERAKKAAEALIEVQPFGVTLAECTGVEVVDRNVTQIV